MTDAEVAYLEVTAEREACARLVDAQAIRLRGWAKLAVLDWDRHQHSAAARWLEEVAAAIRARGQS